MSAAARCACAASRSRDEGSAPVERQALRGRSERAAVRSLQRTLGNRGMGSLLDHASVSRPLDAATRARAEERFGHGFEHVRVHDDQAAHAATAGLRARAFTHGADVFLASGEHADGRLLDHELAHVVQQERGGARPAALDPAAPEERAAGRAAQAGESATVEGATGVGIARQTRSGEAPDPEALRIIQAWLQSAEAQRTVGNTGAGAMASGSATPSEGERAPLAAGSSAAISYPPAPDAFREFLPYAVYGEKSLAGQSDFTPAKPYKSKHFWLVPQLRRTDPVSVYAYVAYDPDAKRNAFILGPAMLPFFFENESMLRAGAGDDERTPFALGPSAAVSYPPSPDAFQGYQMHYVYGDEFLAGKTEFTPIKPYKSKHYWLTPLLRRTDPVSVYAYVAYNPDAQRNELILDPRMLPFFFENEFLFRAIAGASYPFVGEPEPYEVQSARSVLSVMHGDFGGAARHYGAAVPNALASRKFWTQTITSTAPLLKGAPAPAPVQPPPTVIKVPPVAEVPPVAPAPKTVPIVVEGGGATTSSGLSTVSRTAQVVVEQPMQAAQGTARASGPALQQSAVTPRTDVSLSRQGTWTTDPQRVASALPAGEEVTAASLRAASRAPTPGAIEGVAGSIAGTVAQSVRSDRTPRSFPAPSEQERGPRLFPAPSEQDRGPRLFPAPSEEDPTAERLFPRAPQESDDPWLFPEPMSPVRDPVREYLELAGSTPNMSRRRDRRTGDLRELGIAEYREHTYADRRDDALEGHEIVQNAWLQLHGHTSERGTGMASRWNPTIALPPEVHRAVSAYQAALGLYDRKALKKMGYQEMLDLNELALREGLRDSGYSDTTINRVVKRAGQEALEHAIFTIAKGKRRK